MEQHGESDSIELKTRGSFTKKNNAFFISYKESEATGYKGCMTTVKVEDTGTCVSMLRFGSAPSQLVIEKRHSPRMPLRNRPWRPFPWSIGRRN
ncbi:MAG: DUF1934 domain-containing protein [Oscillospiraceae bacterium]